MPGNIDPIFSRQGSLSKDNTTGMNAAILTAANDYTGAGANNSLIWTADATNGGFVERIRAKAIGTNVASVARFFINNGSVNTSAANNVFHGELALPATTITATTTTVDLDYILGFAFDPGFRLYVGLGTTVAAGWTFSVIGGRY